jgi:ectoine hydroxylase-related dioxygenase (phytanoyl-CoA dioxygenase family)
MLELKSPYYQNLLNVNGYFTLKLIDDETIQQLKNIYITNFNDNETTFYSSSFHQDINLKKEVNQQILNLLSETINQYFSNYKVLGTSYLKKQANQHNPLPLHQDWTVTDEENYGSFTIWIPLQDTTIQNGAIRVIPCSHHVENNFRAPSIPVAFEQERQLFEQHLQTLELKAGEAFVFNQKLMHASFPNQTNEERLALTIGLTAKEAKLFMLYFNAQKHEISQYSMPDDMFLHYPDIIEKPLIGTLEKTYSYYPKKFLYTDFLQTLFQNRQQLSTMQALFKNPDHQDFFQKNGYIKFDVLQNNEIEELKNFLFNSGIKKETDYGFYVGMDHENKALVKEMMQKVESIAMPKIAPYLVDYKLITASYVIKDPNPKGVVPPHQDWTFVEDETQHCSVTCWISLVDTNMENGCMGVIKGSNNYFNSVRPSPSPQVPSPLAKHMFSLFPYFDLIPMKAGEALIFDNRTFHASPPNITNFPRLAVGLSFTQATAELRHYYLKPGTKNRLLKYKIDTDFFTKYDNGSLSKMYDEGKLIEDYEIMEEIPFVWEDLSKAEMKNRVLSTGNVYNQVLTQHMMKLFGNQMKSGIREKIGSVLAKLNPLKLVKG